MNARGLRRPTAAVIADAERLIAPATEVRELRKTCPGARMKPVRDPLAVEVIGGVVGVPLRFFPVLALLEIAGGVGLLAGVAVEPLGVAAGACLVVYFSVAITSHLRKRDLVAAHVLPPVMMLVMSAAALTLRLAA